ncbi:hypothetical protein V8B55DRAFT_1508829 [Mucor lusitanicus]|uniref:Uncharacterized protein n=1 Tax=Mucor circinelloides f. lusitanicus TaxID=29924 RepID=A0A8H4F4X2_MUCCL|nr:hypothetical protein FB192DRAFT_1369932 [Mucor lusitanicus]
MQITKSSIVSFVLFVHPSLIQALFLGSSFLENGACLITTIPAVDFTLLKGILMTIASDQKHYQAIDLSWHDVRRLSEQRRTLLHRFRHVQAAL